MRCSVEQSVTCTAFLEVVCIVEISFSIMTVVPSFLEMIILQTLKTSTAVIFLCEMKPHLTDYLCLEVPSNVHEYDVIASSP